jgi:hypothetical protein
MIMDFLVSESLCPAFSGFQGLLLKLFVAGFPLSRDPGLRLRLFTSVVRHKF